MSCFVYWTDTHIREHAPLRRTESDITEVVLNKLRWISNRCAELGAVAAIHGGDLGHYWDWKISLVQKVHSVIKDFPCPVYTVVGNHDVPGKEILLLNHTGLGDLLDKSVNPIRRLWPKDPAVIGPFEFYGFDADTPAYEKLVKGLWEAPNSTAIKVAVAHGPVSNEATPHSIDHKKLFISGFDMVLFGDIHDGFEPYELITGTVVANPGTLFRQKIDEREITPSIFVVNDKKEIVKETVPHTEMKKAFNLAGLVTNKAAIGQGFSNAVAATLKAKDKKPSDIVDEVGKKLKFTQASINRLKDEVNKKK